MEKNEELERRVIALIAADRLYIPVSSIDNKIKKRIRPTLAKAIAGPNSKDDSYIGERIYARIENKNEQKARGVKEGIELFSKQYPQYGTILKGMIEEKREEKETHLYFGMNEGRRLAAEDYLTVMSDLGFGEASARSLYHELIEVSRNISRKRSEERRIMLGTTLGE